MGIWLPSLLLPRESQQHPTCSVIIIIVFVNMNDDDDNDVDEAPRTIYTNGPHTVDMNYRPEGCLSGVYSPPNEALPLICSQHKCILGLLPMCDARLLSSCERRVCCVYVCVV